MACVNAPEEDLKLLNSKEKKTQAHILLPTEGDVLGVASNLNLELSMRLLNKFVGAVSALGLIAGAAQAATVGQPVTIQEGAITGASPNVQIVDQLSGQYDEVISVTPTGATTGTFVTEAIFNAGNWFQNGNQVGTQVNTNESLFGGAGYALYAKFSQKGTYSFSGGTFTFTGFTAGALELWADPLQNTNYDVKTSAAGDIANLSLVSGAASITDDLKLGSASVVSKGSGNSTPADLANGNFEIVFSDFALASPDGESYFIAPRPFYLVLDVNGNFQSFDPLTATDSVLLNNSANAFFVPEPAGLGLVGLAMVGLGLFTRRARK